ncbi:uncharacterized protein PAC_19784 [Phialocephala subalpina]|uniref:Acyltransferase 3 domain-containing protein n=1 Tax=Phialocephala subalpina TaxID=576137 RepID=A0A1L7XY06_9HELO|nr:uncharacterized protein PAC_19784 [Phialocephala subalpina]
MAASCPEPQYIDHPEESRPRQTDPISDDTQLTSDENVFVTKELDESYGDNHPLLENLENQQRQQIRMKWVSKLAPTCRDFISTLRTWVESITPQTIKETTYSAITTALWDLIPSFLQASKPKSTKRHPTEWLDGCRGWAALAVVFVHTYSVFLHDRGIQTLDWFITLPWIYLLLNGHASVAIFFVVSGFSLSYKPVKLTRAGDFAGLAKSMTSSVFRRWPRLYLPIAIITFPEMFLVYYGYFPDRPQNAFQATPHAWTAARPQPTLWMQFEDWRLNIQDRSDPLRLLNLARLFEEGFPYDGNLWTIPIEFRGSMWVFLTVISLASFRTKYRIMLVSVFAMHCLVWVHWDVFLFLCGFLLAELHFVVRERDDPNQESTWKSHIPREVFAAMNYGFATFILSMPVWDPGSEGEFPFETIWWFTPNKYRGSPHHYRFWPAIGAVWYIIAIDNGKCLQKLYTNPLSQYLGRISYCLYLVHGSILKTFGWSLADRMVNMLGFSIGMPIAIVVYSLVVLWFADFTTRVVDEKSVRFGRWVFDKMCRKSSVESGNERATISELSGSRRINQEA